MGHSISVHRHKGKSRPNTPKSATPGQSGENPVESDTTRNGSQNQVGEEVLKQASLVEESLPSGENQDSRKPQDSENRDQENKEVTAESASSSPQVEDTESEDQEERHLERVMSMEPKDIMISYSHQDRDKMRMMRDALEKAGISVWVDETGLKAGVEFLNKIGQAIIDAKLFLSLLSTKSATSKYCKDELALAYVSSKPIYPCMIQPHKQVTEVMDFGMRLQLAPIRWFDFSDEDDFHGSFEKLAPCIKQKLQEITDELNQTTGSDKKRQLTRRETRTRLNVHQILPPTEATMQDFWEVHFKDKDSVPVEE